MVNVLATPEKVATRKGLLGFAERTLEEDGWTISRPAKGGASVRLISKEAASHRISIRTSQDSWIAFPRKTKGEGWVTLDDVDFVVAASVDDRHNPKVARVHMIPGDEARKRFDRAFKARMAAKHTLNAGRGIWLSLYETEASHPVSLVGAGMGLDFKAIATLDLTKFALPTGDGSSEDDSADDEGRSVSPATAAPEVLTIPEAKRLLAKTLGVPESAIKITVEH